MWDFPQRLILHHSKDVLHHEPALQILSTVSEDLSGTNIGLGESKNENDISSDYIIPRWTLSQ